MALYPSPDRCSRLLDPSRSSDLHERARIFCRYQYQRARRARWCSKTLLPFLQGAHGNAEQLGKLRLRQASAFANVRDRGNLRNPTVFAALDLADPFENLCTDTSLGLTHQSPPESCVGRRPEYSRQLSWHI